METKEQYEEIDIEALLTEIENCLCDKTIGRLVERGNLRDKETTAGLVVLLHLRRKVELFIRTIRKGLYQDFFCLKCKSENPF